MRIEDIINKKASAISLGFGIALFGVSLFTLNTFAIWLSFMFLWISIITFNYGYAIVGSITRALKIKEKKTNYTISKERNCIITNYPNRTLFIIEILMKNSSRAEVSKLIEAVNFPFTLACAVESKDSEKIINSLKLKRAMLEIELEKSRTKEKISKRIAEIDNQINEISNAKPLNVRFFAIVSAEGESESESKSRCEERVKTLVSAIHAIIGADATVLVDQDLERAIDTILFADGINEY